MFEASLKWEDSSSLFGQREGLLISSFIDSSRKLFVVPSISIFESWSSYVKGHVIKCITDILLRISGLTGFDFPIVVTHSLKRDSIAPCHGSVTGIAKVFLAKFELQSICSFTN